MKKLIVLVVIVTALGLGGAVFRSDIAKSLASTANEQLAHGVELFLKESALPPAAAAQVRSVSKQMDAKLLLELLADPKAFVSGASEHAEQFMKTPAGAKLREALQAAAASP